MLAFNTSAPAIEITTHKSLMQRIISGKISNGENGDPLTGATIQVKGTTTGTVSDMNGNYQIELPGNSTVVIFSFIGFQTKEITIHEDQHSMDIQLYPELLSMDEVVVTGQGGSISKKRLSSNIEIINAKEIENIPAQRLDQLLAAELPNAQLNLTGGQSGATSIIRARGITSAFLNSTPVIYIDGVRIDNLNTRSS